MNDNGFLNCRSTDSEVCSRNRYGCHSTSNLNTKINPLKGKKQLKPYTPILWLYVKCKQATQVQVNRSISSIIRRRWSQDIQSYRSLIESPGLMYTNTAKNDQIQQVFDRDGDYL
jgi:hypothetical protein